MELTSRDNALVKDIARLLGDAKARRKSGRFVIEGARLCEDAVRSGICVTAALSTPVAAERYAAQWEAICATAQKVYTLSSALFAHLSDTGSPQGILCVCEIPTHSLSSVSPDGVYLALEDLQDPGNLGTVIRTAEALGVDGVLLSGGCCDLYNPKVLRASMGGVFRLPMKVCSSFADDLLELRAQMPVLACVLDGTLSVTKAPKSGAVAVIGNEGNGITEKTVAVCTHRVTIPMAGRAESLNASMAAGIVLWELCRDRCEEGFGR